MITKGGMVNNTHSISFQEINKTKPNPIINVKICLKNSAIVIESTSCKLLTSELKREVNSPIRLFSKKEKVR
jgi:hypothetical protein